MNIINSINKYMEKRTPYERYTSFDYCYTYFYEFYRQDKISELANKENLQISCLQLGFYLASWGMMRSSTLLFKKSFKHLENLIKTISNENSILWEIDINKYTNKNIKLLLNFKEQIVETIKYENRIPTETMITKIMLGIFGNVPAFDRNFTNSNLNVKNFNKNSLLELKRFYNDNEQVFDSLKFYTLDFHSGKNTDISYTNAKLIDMYGFIDGQSK